MGGTDQGLFEKLRSDLVICEHERKRLSEKLDCLIALLRRAWHGKTDSIQKLSEIIGLPAPKIIPCDEDAVEQEALSNEYLQITSSLLDSQLKDDLGVKRNTKSLRSPSSRTRKTPIRIQSAPIFSQRSGRFEAIQSSHEVGKDLSPGKTSHKPRKGKTLSTMALSDLLPRFSQIANLNGQYNYETYSTLESPSRAESCPKAVNSIHSKFNQTGVAQRTRPLSAALQQRQDYLRSQNRRKNTRPQSAKPAFKFSELELPRDLLSPSQYDYDYVQSSTPPIVSDDSHHSISVDISTKPVGGNVLTEKRIVFPDERDADSLGDVTEALRRVQEMQMIFRRNTKRLQQRIGIPEAGCI